MSPSTSPRTASSWRTSGARSACSRAAGGCTTRSTGRSRTSCCSAARSTTSNSRRRPPVQRPRCCPSDCPGDGGGGKPATGGSNVQDPIPFSSPKGRSRYC